MIDPKALGDWIPLAKAFLRIKNETDGDRELFEKARYLLESRVK